MAREYLEIKVTIPPDLVERTMAVFDENVRRANRQTGVILKRVTRFELEAREHVASKELVNSLHTEITKADTLGWIVSLTTLDVAARALEYGTSPASNESEMVNVTNILLWLEEKDIEPDYGTQEDFAYAIARKIGRLGMTVGGIPVKGNQRRPFNAAQKKARREIENLWRQTVENIAGEFNSLG